MLIWRYLRGPKNSISARMGAAALPVGTPVRLVDGLAVAVAANSIAHGVLHENGAANEENVRVEMLVPGSVWEARLPTPAPALLRGAMVALDATGRVVARPAAPTVSWSPGIVVDRNVATTSTVASIYIHPRD